MPVLYYLIFPETVSVMVDVLLEKESHLLRSGRLLPVREALQGKQVLAFYFSAHWCPPCRQFTPVLAQAYRQARAQGE
jgi:nucleoredoxin